MNAIGAATKGVSLAPVVIKLVTRLHNISRSPDVRDASRKVGEAIGEAWVRIRDLRNAVTDA